MIGPGAPENTRQRILLERRHERRELNREALIRNCLQGRIGGQVLDISENGCKLFLHNNSARAGQMITIKMEGLESLSGTIRWIDDGFAGVEFHRQLYPAVVDHLSRTGFEVEIA